MIFNLLCGGLLVIGMILGYNYEEISVYICIYLWPILCCLAALFTTILLFYNWIKKCTFLQTMLLSLYTCISFVFISLTRQFFHHYQYYGDNINTVHQQFVLCMNDIQNIANQIGISYSEANLYIYVYLFCIIMLFMWLTFELVFPKKWILNRIWRKN